MFRIFPWWAKYVAFALVVVILVGRIYHAGAVAGAAKVRAEVAAETAKAKRFQADMRQSIESDQDLLAQLSAKRISDLDQGVWDVEQEIRREPAAVRSTVCVPRNLARRLRARQQAD